ncbi:Zn(II)2Cys6 transcription factor [Aspergillus candidus]|uniref:Zn(2)-C6 fungal-type domain-containing protein n=1 Tax=Aspergillus candidus TaxID=41067 RepID=A0A2I2FBJ0_ASPCN|nr:hypothetical protein BDW47DRAFT_131677 [Aspergillus candidus]PLB37999.1 hypothetical protein BDW47DRAFT_131677 [Aspergillus candidus]
MADQTQKPRRRRGAGCRTCRIRRVKCDQGRPTCRRCDSTGRACDGYEVTNSCPSMGQTKRCLQPKPSSPLASSVGSPLELSLEELEAFHFFRQNSAHEIPNCFPSNLWERIILQMTHQEPSIRHAVVAVGSLHRRSRGMAGTMGSSGGMKWSQEFPILQYIKALHHLRQRLSRTHDPLAAPVALIACLLFMCLEMLQGNRMGAVGHLRTGLQILAGIPSLFAGHCHQLPHRYLHLQSTFSTTLLHQVAAQFASLDLEATMFGERSPVLHLAAQEVEMRGRMALPASFSSVDEARIYLEILSNRLLCLRGELLQLAEKHLHSRDVGWVVRHCQQHALVRTIDLTDHPSLLNHVAQLQTHLAAWLVAFRSLTMNPLYGCSRATMLLEMRQFSMAFVAATIRETQEVRCDQFHPQFWRMVSIARRFVHNLITAQPSPTFTLVSGGIHCLYIVATKCRDPTTRREAIMLLRQIPCQEGMWDGPLMARFAEQLVEWEESMAQGIAGRRVHTPEDVSEAARVTDAVLVGVDRPGRGRLVCARHLHETTGELLLMEREFTL